LYLIWLKALRNTIVRRTAKMSKQVKHSIFEYIDLFIIDEGYIVQTIIYPVEFMENK